MKQVVYVTGNPLKFNVAQKALENSNIELIQEKLDTPEIQSENGEEVAAYSAEWASEKLGRPVIVSDFGVYIEALNGFPGPFIKYINHWLSSEDIIRLMSGKENRKIIERDYLAYCEPGAEPVVFIGENFGTITTELGQKKYRGYTLDQIFTPEGFDKVQSEIPEEQMIEFWNRGKVWEKLSQYLTKI